MLLAVSSLRISCPGSPLWPGCSQRRTHLVISSAQENGFFWWVLRWHDRFLVLDSLSNYDAPPAIQGQEAITETHTPTLLVEPS